MNSPQLLSTYEGCNRAGGYARDWERYKLSHTEMLLRGIREGITTQRTDFNEAAGEAIVASGAEPGLDSREHNIYDAVIHLATIADIVTTALRKPNDLPWERTKPVQIGDGPMWQSDAMLDPSGTHLRSVALVSGWSDDRHYSLCRSWEALGSVCVYGLPMQIAVVIVGQYKTGKRHGFWSHGLLHPVSKKVRFRKKNNLATGFKESWLPVWREDHDEIPTTTWLDAMLADGVLSDVCFKIDLPVPERAVRKKILDLASAKLERIEKMKVLPEQNLSTCFWPDKCEYIKPCHNNEMPSGKYGFVRVEELHVR